jgi:uncharacterized protein (UPF0332 family)
MKESFLNKLKRENKLNLVEPSKDICESYLEKANNCFKSSKLLLDNKLYENSVSMAYYAMYNSLTALLFKIGIKCENHTGSIILLKQLLKNKELFEIISYAKKERVDKQYYVTSKKDLELTEESSNDMVDKAEKFLIEIKLTLNNLGLNDIEDIRNKYGVLL